MSDYLDLNIISDVENKILKRREIGFSVVEEAGTVSKSELKTDLCKKLNLNPDYTVICSINQNFGIRKSDGVAHAYKSKEDMERLEPKYILNRLSKKNKGEAAATAQGDNTEKGASADSDKKVS